MGDIADQAERGDSGEGVHESSGGVGNDYHIALIDCLEASNAGAVEEEALFKNRFCKRTERNAEMLPGSWKIGEFQIDHFGAIFFCKP
ncbi:hypothetical protein KSC_068270 [Ktedonobacter sp. SOSP1-52]|nr:hypothetical protein KSC_068270 [Ktedonobacter sp. SOSP1-52]